MSTFLWSFIPFGVGFLIGLCMGVEAQELAKPYSVRDECEFADCDYPHCGCHTLEGQRND